MDVRDRLDSTLRTVLESKGWKRQGTRRFLGQTHVVEMLPATTEDRVTVFFGRCARPGDASRLADCSRITLTDQAQLDTFLMRL